MANLESKDEIEVNKFNIPKEVSNYIDDLYCDYKATLGKISELKKKNSKLKQ